MKTKQRLVEREISNEKELQGSFVFGVNWGYISFRSVKIGADPYAYSG
jgi:hypothetical protein